MISPNIPPSQFVLQEKYSTRIRLKQRQENFYSRAKQNWIKQYRNESKSKSAEPLLRQTQLMLVQDKIVDGLKASQPLSLSDMGKLVESDIKTVRKALEGLKRIGYIQILFTLRKANYYVVYNNHDGIQSIHNKKLPL